MKRQSARGGIEGFERGCVSSPPRLLGSHLNTPLQIAEETEGASLIGPIGTDVPCGHGRADGSQFRAAGR